MKILLETGGKMSFEKTREAITLKFLIFVLSIEWYFFLHQSMLNYEELLVSSLLFKKASNILQSKKNTKRLKLL